MREKKIMMILMVDMKKRLLIEAILRKIRKIPLICLRVFDEKNLFIMKI
jgi:hypothetical protein